MALSDIVEVRVEFGLGAAGATGSLWDSALWDEGLWSSSNIQWTDMTNLVEGFTTKLGKQAFLKRSRTGLSTIVLDNTHGWFTPDAGVDPPGFIKLRPGRFARIVARPVVDMEWQPIWFGKIDTIENMHRGGNLTAVVRCVDGFADLAVDDTIEQPAQGAGERSDLRIIRILDHHDWPQDRRDIEPGSFTMQATTLAQPALFELQITTDSEGGDLWQKPDGAIAFRGRDWLPDVVTWTLGGPLGIPLAAVETEWTQQRVVNEAHYAATGSTVQVATDLGSQAVYGRRTYRRLDLINDSDGDVLQLAGEVVAALKADRVLVRTATVTVQDTVTAQFVTEVTFGDLIQVTVDTMWGWSSTYLLHVISVIHDVTAEGWSVTVGLTDYAVVNEFGPYARPEYSEAFHLGGEAIAENI